MNEITTLSRYLDANRVSGLPFVYLIAPTHLKTIIAFLAILKAGLSCVLIDPDTGRIELSEIRENTPPCAVIMIDTAAVCFDYGKEIRFMQDSHPHTDIQPVEPSSTLIYTAGENGHLMAAVRSEKNLYLNNLACIETNNYDTASVICSYLPFSHIYGIQVVLIGMIIENGTIIIDELLPGPDVMRLAGHIEKYGISHVYTVPLVYYLLSKVPGVEKKMDSVRLLVSGGYKLPEMIYDNYINKCGIEIHEGYGLSEVSFCAFNYALEKPNIRSVGKTKAFCTVSIKDEKGKEVSPGYSGEVCVRGKSVMKGYYNQPGETARALSGGWFHTGDLGKVDKDGYLYLTGLKKSMINVCGKKVYPRELERLLAMNNEVASARVYGIKKEIVGEIVKAEIRLKENTGAKQEEFLSWCRDNISLYKIPKRIDFI